MKRFLAGVSLLTLELYAQFPGFPTQRTVHGQVISDRQFTESYSVELNTTGATLSPALRCYTTPNGDFQIEGVSDGNYQLTITDHQGRRIQQQLVHVDSSGTSIEVRLPSEKHDAPPSGSVTFAELNHKVPRKARNELKAAEEARSQGDHQNSMLHLEKALRIDPDFAAAHNDLAMDYMSLHRFENALTELERAEKLDPAAEVIEINRAACLLEMGRLKDAESAARRSVQINGTSPRSRFALGLVLVNERKFTPEAIDNLLLASRSMPAARLVAAQIFADKGQVTDAREQLHLYLEGCSGEQCKVAQDALEHLERAQDRSK